MKIEMGSFDGRAVSKVGSVYDYFKITQGMSEEDYYKFSDDNEKLDDLIREIIGLVYSHRCLRCTSHVCGSIVESIYHLLMDKVSQLKNEHNIEFDMDLFEYF